MAIKTIDEWLVERHAREVSAGLHDDQCEWRASGFFLCHCAKRRREASGLVEPLEDLCFECPPCPNCGREVSCDGDSYRCDDCSTAWDLDGRNAHFFDVYCDDLAAEAAEWSAKHPAKVIEEEA
jgi:hypothetical protein